MDHYNHSQKLQAFQTLDLAQLVQEHAQIVPEGVWLKLCPAPQSWLSLTRYQLKPTQQLEASGESLLEADKSYWLRPSECFHLKPSDVLDSSAQNLGQAEFFCIPTLYFNKKFNHINGLGQAHSEVAYFKAYYSQLHPQSGQRSLKVLDLGCGRGRNAVLFAEEYQILGVDQNPDSLAVWNDMAQTEGYGEKMQSALVDLNSWREAPEHDIAMAIVSLQFLEAQAAIELLQHCMQKASPGALHLAVFPIVNEHPSIIWPGSFHFLPQSQEVKDLYIHNGWSILEYRENYGHLGRAQDGLPLRGLFATLIAQKAY